LDPAARLLGDRTKLLFELALEIGQPVELKLPSKGLIEIAREAAFTDTRLRLSHMLLAEGGGHGLRAHAQYHIPHNIVVKRGRPRFTPRPPAGPVTAVVRRGWSRRPAGIRHRR
jgi:hypothetical protein